VRTRASWSRSPAFSNIDPYEHPIFACHEHEYRVKLLLILTCIHPHSRSISSLLLYPSLPSTQPPSAPARPSRCFPSAHPRESRSHQTNHWPGNRIWGKTPYTTRELYDLEIGAGKVSEKSLSEERSSNAHECTCHLKLWLYRAHLAILTSHLYLQVSLDPARGYTCLVASYRPLVFACARVPGNQSGAHFDSQEASPTISALDRRRLTSGTING